MPETTSKKKHKAIECREACLADMCWLRLVDRQLKAIHSQLKAVEAVLYQIGVNLKECPVGGSDENTGIDKT